MIARALGVVVLALLVVIVWQRGTAAKHETAATLAASRADAAESRADALTAERDALAAALAGERERAEKLNDIADRYERERNEAQQHADKLAADLRAGTLRLRERWQARVCPAGDMPATAAATGITDAAAADRAESAARIIGAAAECDAQVRGLQAVIRADRNE